MTDTANLIMQSNLYQEDDDDDNENDIGNHKTNNAGGDYNFEIDLEGGNEEEGPVRMDDDEYKRFHNHLLALVQMTGTTQTVNGYDMYVKDEHCDDQLKDIFKILKTDGNQLPYARLAIGEWNFVKNDLLPILVFHKQDKKLQYITLMNLVLLTELPHEDCQEKAKMY
jgi:hypothetical protein